MWNNLTAKAPGGAGAGGQSQAMAHGVASGAAHVAANRAKARAVLSGGAHANFKHHIAAALTTGGIPTSPQDVQAGIGAMTQQGQFTPQQGQGLMQHNGMLHGPQGLATIAKIGAHVAQAKRGGPPMGGPGGAPMLPPQQNPMAGGPPRPPMQPALGTPSPMPRPPGAA